MAADFHIFIYTAIRYRANHEFIGSHNCLPMALTAESPPAQGQEILEVVPVTTGAAFASPRSN